MPGPLCRREARGDDGVPQPGAVEMHEQAVLVCPGADGLDLLDGVDPAATAVVRVLQADEPGAHQVVVHWPDLVLQLAHVEDAIVTFDRATGDTAEDGGTSCLEVVDVTQ